MKAVVSKLLKHHHHLKRLQALVKKHQVQVKKQHQAQAKIRHQAQVKIRHQAQALEEPEDYSHFWMDS
jgi:hypothetical protein